MVVTNLTPVAVAGQPPVIISMVIKQMQTPGLTPDKTIWAVVFTLSDGSTQSYGLTTKNVQYWVDNLAVGNVTDNTGGNNYSPNATFATVSAQAVALGLLTPSAGIAVIASTVTGKGSSNAETQTGRTVSISVADQTNVKAS